MSIVDIMPHALIAAFITALVVSASQIPLNPAHSAFKDLRQDDYYQFTDEIRRVAVIGAGATGLQTAASLIEHGFEVRLFERADNSGGNWYYQDQTPIHASFPNKPIVNASYIPDIPPSLPYTHIYAEGEDGVSNGWRLREHENPSPVWKNLTTLSPTLPNIQYPPDLPSKVPNRYLQRYVRQYASAHGLNANDKENANVTSYSTRVERVHKPKGAKRWTLTLRKMQRVPYSNGNVRVDWWAEEFDAVVVAAGALEAPWVPSIPNLNKWANAFPERIYHSSQYRTPSGFEGKNVLIVGGAISAYGIALDLLPRVSSVSLSVRDHPLNESRPVRSLLLGNLPANVSIIPEMKGFPDSVPSNNASDIRNLQISLVNGSAVSGYDHIIFATGFRRSNPFLTDFHNSTIKGYDEPETEVAPIITDGTHVRSLHWTGHYIDDPTLVVMALVVWAHARYQALGISRVWSGKARLPGRARMWEEYLGSGKELLAEQNLKQWYARMFVTWLNDAALEFGGRFVEPLPKVECDVFCHTAMELGANFAGATSRFAVGETPVPRPIDDDTWAEWNPYW